MARNDFLISVEGRIKILKDNLKGLSKQNEIIYMVRKFEILTKLEELKCVRNMYLSFLLLKKEEGSGVGGRRKKSG